MPPAKTGGFIFAHSLRRVRVFSPKCPVRLLSCFFSGSFKNILFYFTKNLGNYKNGELILIFSQNKFTASPIWKSVYSYDYLSPCLHHNVLLSLSLCKSDKFSTDSLSAFIS